MGSNAAFSLAGRTIRRMATRPTQTPPADVDSAVAAGFRRKLLAWFDREKRDMPWRHHRDPYAIWLSEMMLQQTQVATVIPYYERFTERFPTVKDLASADLDEVLQLWAGLGYYARARNMHRAAGLVVSDFGGEFPSTVEALRTLPGVGEYSAGAVASIAYDIRTPVVDGNVVRVLSRLFGIADDPGTGAGHRRIWRLAERLLPRKRCGDFNQALMELGATVCRPGDTARCEACPVRQRCAALASDAVATLPTRTPRVATRSETHVVAAIEYEGRWLFRRRDKKGLWGGLWEMPSVVLNGEGTAAAARRVASGLLGSNLSTTRKPFCRFKHVLTHREITFVGHVCRIGRGSKDIPRPVAGRWKSLDKLESLGLSTAMRKLIVELRRATVKGNRTVARASRL